MTGCPEITVVVPLFNQAKFVTGALRSALLQGQEHIEIVVVDDGSSDGGAEVVRAVGDPRVRIVSQPNGGVSAARNRGIREARAALVAFLDADDEWLPGFLDAVLRLARAHPECGLFATSYWVWYPDGTRRRALVRGFEDDGWEGVLEDYFGVATISEPPVWSSATAARKDALDEVGGFPVGVTAGEDLLTWARIAVRHGVAYSSTPRSLFRQASPESGPPKRVPQLPDLVGPRLRDLLPLAPPGVHRGLRRYVGHWHRMRASVFMRLGDGGNARREVVQAFGLHRWDAAFLTYCLLALAPGAVQQELVQKIRVLRRRVVEDVP